MSDSPSTDALIEYRKSIRRDWNGAIDAEINRAFHHGYAAAQDRLRQTVGQWNPSHDDRSAADGFVSQYLGSDASDGLDEYDKCVHAFLEGQAYGRTFIDPRLIPLRNLAVCWLGNRKIGKDELTEAFRSFLEVVCLPAESEDKP